MNSEEKNDTPDRFATNPDALSGVAAVRALVVDDDALVLWTTVKRLERLGWHVTGAESGPAAEELWGRNRFDIVLMDYRLADGTGVDVVANMRQAGRREPVVCLTAESERIDADTCRALAIGAVWNKPVDLDALVTAAHGLIGAHAPASTHRASGADERVGRFRMAVCSGHVTVAELTQVAQDHATEDWLALDMGATDDMEAEAAATLLDMGRTRTRRGGRLCLMGLSPAWHARFRAAGWTREIDLVDDVAGLISQNRRLISAAERESLLDSVIERDEP
jgi:CheY-like chemotaxis protein/anti-anti-sigma regulatory factor